ncbi:hypothetical protein Tco_1393910 [Tanacetum coccineum]
MRGSVDYGSWVSSISPSRTIGWLLVVVDMARLAGLKGSIGSGRESDMFLKTLSSTKSRFLEGVGLITKASHRYGWRFVTCDGPEAIAVVVYNWNWVSWDDLFSTSGTILAVPFCLCVYFGDGGFRGLVGCLPAAGICEVYSSRYLVFLGLDSSV